MADKKAKKTAVKKNVTFNITKSNGKVIQRPSEFVNEDVKKIYEAKGWKVEEA